MTTIASRLQAVKARISEAARAGGRSPGEITLVAVSKTFPPQAIAEACAAGQTDFGENYAQEGIYVSYAPRLDDPSLWTTPQKILNGGKWYPQVIGSTPNVGTDKLAAGSPRFFMSGKSEWVINFAK